MFFSTQLATDRGVGQEVLQGTPLRMPNNPDMDSIRKVVSQLLDVDAPFVFSLPDNIERSLQRSTSTAVILQLRALSTLTSEADKFDREKWRLQLNPTLELWKTLYAAAPVQRDRHRDNNKSDNAALLAAAMEGNSSGKQTSPIDEFVKMEYEFAGEMCLMIDSMLEALRKVLFGAGLLTPVIHSIATALLSDRVPAEWTTKPPKGGPAGWQTGPETSPQGWLRELIRKRVALQKWVNAVNKGVLLDAGAVTGANGAHSGLVLGDLFNPSTFINALRQQTTRILKVPIDQLKLVCYWGASETGKESGGRGKSSSVPKSLTYIDSPLTCILSGLLLQGAGFHQNLQESRPDANELSGAPNVTIGFVDKTDHTPIYTSETAVGVPVYLTPTREEFLMELQMPIQPGGNTDDSAHKWVMAGVALFLTEE